MHRQPEPGAERRKRAAGRRSSSPSDDAAAREDRHSSERGDADGASAEGASPFERFGARLLELLRADPELRAAGLALSSWLRAACGDDPASESSGGATGASKGDAPDVASAVEQLSASRLLSLGGRAIRVHAQASEPDAETPPLSLAQDEPEVAEPADPAKVDDAPRPQRRSRDPYEEGDELAESLKRAAADFRGLAGADSPAAMHEMRRTISRAWQERDEWLWIGDADKHGVTSDACALFAELYATTAKALRFAVRVLSDAEAQDEDKRRALTRLAEAQSALRVALEDHAQVRFEDLQQRTFRWLQARTAIDQIFVREYMRLDNPGDPDGWKDTRSRLAAEERRWNAALQERRQRAQLEEVWSALHDRLRSIRREGPTRVVTDLWRRFENDLASLIRGGLQPSNRELREALVPALDYLPEGYRPKADFTRVLEELDRFQARAESEAGAAGRTAPRTTSAEAERVAELLRGRELVLIGGEERPDSKAAIVRDFGLADLTWIETSSKPSYKTFESAIARPETAVVVLAIRWASHSYENVRALCDKHDKAYVRLPGGYNPNQVAYQILEQVSDRLAN